jgi:hypothetical protein
VKIGAGYGRRAALAMLASVGLVVLIGHLHMRILVSSTAAQAAPASPPAASDGQDQVKPGGGSPSAGFAASLGAGFAAAAANAMARQISRLCLRRKVVVYGRFAAGSKFARGGPVAEAGTGAGRQSRGGGGNPKNRGRS